MAKEMESFRRRSPEKQFGPSLTKQQFKEESDINTIVNRHLRTNTPFPQGDQRFYFGDVTAADFQSMMNQVADVEFAFGSLPARLRRRFSNSPYQLVRWVEDPANREEAIKLGLLPEPPAKAVTEAENAPAHIPPEEEHQLQQEAAKADEEAQPSYRNTASRPAAKPRPKK